MSPLFNIPLSSGLERDRYDLTKVSHRSTVLGTMRVWKTAFAKRKALELGTSHWGNINTFNPMDYYSRHFFFSYFPFFFFLSEGGDIKVQVYPLHVPLTCTPYTY